MSIEPAFKALDYDLKLYGFWPTDLFGLFVLFGLTHGVFDSLVLDAVVISPLSYLAWRGRKRPRAYLRSLLFYASTPARLAVGLRRESR